MGGKGGCFFVDNDFKISAEGEQQQLAPSVAAPCVAATTTGSCALSLVGIDFVSAPSKIATSATGGRQQRAEPKARTSRSRADISVSSPSEQSIGHCLHDAERKLYGVPAVDVEVDVEDEVVFVDDDIPPHCSFSSTKPLFRSGYSGSSNGDDNISHSSIGNVTTSSTISSSLSSPPLSGRKTFYPASDQEHRVVFVGASGVYDSNNGDAFNLL
jgi:hypothetical protein